MGRDIAMIAAKWWADHLRTTPKMNSGDALNSLVFAIQASDNTDLDELSISLFELALRNEIDLFIARDNYAWIGVDYEPDDLLEKAAQIAGIDLDKRLPIKTLMAIEDQRKIHVKVGYGAPFETINVGE